MMVKRKKIANALQKIERSSWMIIGGAFGIAFGVVLSFISDFNIAISVVAGLVLTIALTQLGETVRKDELDEIISTFNNIRHDKFLRNTIDDLVEYYFSTKEYHNELFEDHMNDTITTFLDGLFLLSEGTLRPQLRDEVHISLQIIRSTSGTFKASSLAQFDTINWWRSPEGMAYIKENIHLIEQGGKVTRVFLFGNEDELNKFMDILVEQSKLGIGVYVGINLPDYLRESYVISDDKIVRIEKNLVGYEVSSTIHIKEQIVRHYVRLFEDLLYRSKRLDTILQERLK